MSATRHAIPLDVFGCPLDGVQLIEASAGTGKTWNICGLYLRLVLEQALEVQKILVVTFTKAATAELRERIRDRLVEVLAQLERRGPASGDPFAAALLEASRAKGLDDDVMMRRLRRAIRNFDEASIFTIHGFCKRALDDTPVAAGMPLRQEMLEDDSELRQEAANDFWRRRIAGGGLSPVLAGWLVAKRDSPDRLAALLRRHCAKTTSQVLWPEGTEGARVVPDPVAFHNAHAHARALWLRERNAIARCVNDSMGSLNGNVYKPETVAKAVEQWDAVFASEDPAARVPTGDKLTLFTRGRYKAKKNVPACIDHAFFDAAEALMNAWTALVASLEAARWHLLREFVETVPGELRQRKRSRRLLAFDDMLFNLDERLASTQGEALAQALRERFPAALIDEFQDTDPLQFRIFDGIYGKGGTLFLVGDPKQAIYSFRNADLQTYLKAADRAAHKYTLDENQRSSESLIAALNSVFGANPDAFMLEGLAYANVTCGRKKRKSFEDRTLPRAPLHLWSLPLEDDGPMKQPAKQAATTACAAEIARLLAAAQAREVLHGGNPLQAGEIAVLVRSHREGSQMREALAALGVGSVELAQTSVFETLDAEELERVLFAILEPSRDARVRSALATELLGFDAAAVEEVSADEARMGELVQRFAAYRDAWVQRGVGPMLRQLAVSEGVNARMLARADGERRLTNFRHLAECLHDASGDHAGPEALLRWFQRQRRENRAEAFQVRLESDRNLVQIVTIHKSKGLEYPVVFCPYLFDGHKGGGSRELPIGREYHDDSGQAVIDYRSVDKEEDLEVRARIDIERDAERLRLAYVALTRAVHRCYLVVGGYFSKVGFGGTSSSESGCNPLNWLVTGRGMAPEAWRKVKTPPALILQAWTELANANRGSMAIEELPRTPGVPVQLPRPAPESLAALPPPARIPNGWQLSSYSSLAHGVRGDAGAVDHDARAERDEVPKTPPPEVPEDDVLRFVRGARAGDALHAVFEAIDFSDESRWQEKIAAALRARPAGAPAGQPVAAMMANMARDVLGTTLPDGIVLSQVRRRITELEFALSAPSLSTGRLVALLQRFGYPPVDIQQPALRGFLRGFIDLVFEHEGRFHVLDWKSTHLGWRAADYSKERMAHAMQAQGYHLQYLLYTLAVHRWLRARLPSYDYDRHFGGVLYLFVRGVRASWQLADGSPAAVFQDRPPRELIEALDAEFSGGRREAA